MHKIRSIPWVIHPNIPTGTGSCPFRVSEPPTQPISERASGSFSAPYTSPKPSNTSTSQGQMHSQPRIASNHCCTSLHHDLFTKGGSLVSQKREKTAHSHTSGAKSGSLSALSRFSRLSVAGVPFKDRLRKPWLGSYAEVRLKFG